MGFIGFKEASLFIFPLWKSGVEGILRFKEAPNPLKGAKDKY